MLMATNDERVRNYWFGALQEAIQGDPVKLGVCGVSFNNYIRLKVGYPKKLLNGGNLQITFNEMLKPEETDDAPVVTYTLPSWLANERYTLVMTDPDAPTRNDPIYREFIHWVMVRIPNICGVFYFLLVTTLSEYR